MILFLLAVPLLIYVGAALSVPRSTSDTPSDFFAAFRRSSTIPFSNSSIAYALQVATIYPFLTWAVTGAVFVPLLNAVFWGLGILLFSSMVPRLKKVFGTNLTLHGYLGMAYKSSLIRIVTSSLTLIGLMGIALAEIIWGSQAVAVTTEGSQYTYAVVAIMVLVVFAYIAYGGQVSSFRTDQLQLLFSYVGILSLLVMLFARASRLGVAAGNLTRWSAIVAIGYVIAILAIRRGNLLARTGGVISFGRFITGVSNVLVALFLVGVVGVAILLVPPTSSPLRYIQLDGFGLLGLTSMILLPLGFQFVDMTNWQRLLALQGERDEEIQAARKGLHLYAVESPFTWIVFLMIGAAAADVFPDLTGSANVLIDLPRALLSDGTSIGYWSTIVFLISLVAIMLSTIDSVLMAAMFTFTRDIQSALVDDEDWHRSDQKAQQVIWKARAFGAVLMIGGVGGYVLVNSLGVSGDQFIGTLFAFYTAQLAMLPLVLGAMLLKKPPPAAYVIPGLAASAVSGIGLGLYSTFSRPELQWWPVPICLAMSFVFYGIALAIHLSRSSTFKKKESL